MFPCDCDTVWFIRRLKISRPRRVLLTRAQIFCESDRARGILETVRMIEATEAQFCPQKGLC